MVWLGVLISVIIGYLGVGFIRRRVGRALGWETEGWSDAIKSVLIPVAAWLTIVAYLHTQNAKEIAEKSLQDAKQTINQLESRELLRPWAMIVPTGERANDIFGINLDSQGIGIETKRHQKIFIRQDSRIKVETTKCPEQGYRNELKYLTDDYPKMPYASVILALCLKKINDPDWKAEGERARQVLEKLLVIQPHVLSIDAHYARFFSEMYLNVI